MPTQTVSRSELAALVPYGFVVTRPWLMDRGVGRHAVDNLLKSGRLVSRRRGVYALPESRLVWQGVVSSLQRMGFDCVVGGLTALELHGRAHYLPLGRRRTLLLHGRDPLPSWINRMGLDERFERRGSARLMEAAGPGEHGGAADREPFFTVELPWGDGLGTVRISTIERAFFEVLNDVPARISFEHADLLMENLPDLSPRRLNALLPRTRSFKVKRLFFWLAERQSYVGLKRLEPSVYNLGRGKRVLEKGGKLASRYGITVPREMYG